MGNIAQKLQNIIDSKAAISAAIEAKGGTVPTELTGYGAAIEALPSGGGSDVVAKIVDRSVTEVTAADLNGVTKIGGYAFFGCYKLMSVTIPSGVRSIGSNAFSGCSVLSSITIPNSVTQILINAFDSCIGLTSITIPDSVTNIGTGAFRGCSKLTSITIPAGVTSIATYIFQNCSALTSITIPDGVTSIGDSAFRNCSNCLIFDFSNHTSVPTLANVNAFTGTNANKKIVVPDDLYDSWKAANNWNSSTNGIVDAITKASEA